MNCDEVMTVIARYLAGESKPAEAAAVEEHLSTCDQCAKHLATDRQLDASLREALLEDEPDASAVVQHVMTRLRHVPWWKQLFAVGFLRFAAVGALVLLVFVVGRGVYIHRAEKGLAMAAAHDHYMDLVVLKRNDWAYSGESSAAFVQVNFPGTPELVRSITPAGGTLEKVRFCGLKGAHYAHFVFQTPQGEVSVFLRPKQPGDYTPGNLNDQSTGLEVAGFSSPSFVGAVVGQIGVPTGAIAVQEARSL